MEGESTRRVECVSIGEIGVSLASLKTLLGGKGVHEEMG